MVPSAPATVSPPVPATFVEVPTEKVPDILEAIPVERRGEFELLLRQSILAKSHRGPLPPPEDLERYCALIPDGGERIMVRHEKQSDHRMELERDTLKSQLSQSSTGQWMGFVLGALGLSLGGFCIYTGHDVAGAALSGLTLTGLVSVFVAGKTELIQSLVRKTPRAQDETEAGIVQANRQVDVRGKDKPTDGK